MALCTTALVGIVVLLVVMTGKACGGWSLVKNDLDRSNFAKFGYDMAYPMGGDLTNATSSGKPGFLISAVRDPEGANLDRGQVVKGWIEADGSTRERVRRELYQCHWFPFLQTFWADKDIDPTKRAFYYVRVLEIPTPRWTTYDAKAFNVKIPEGAPVDVQERAYTSPIWYTP